MLPSEKIPENQIVAEQFRKAFFFSLCPSFRCAPFPDVYQFYAELLDYEPKIWRRFQVPGNITLSQLGYIVMTLYEMKGSHLFQFIAPNGFNHAIVSATNS